VTRKICQPFPALVKGEHCPVALSQATPSPMGPAFGNTMPYDAAGPTEDWRNLKAGSPEHQAAIKQSETETRQRNLSALDDPEVFQEAVEEAAKADLQAERFDRAVSQRKRELSDTEDSWDFVDLEAAWDADPIVPTVGQFIESDTSNGGGLFYAGKINEIHGQSESGKTMAALAVAAQEIRDGHHVIMVDFEDDAKSVIGRLRDVFRLTKGQILGQFHYVNPSQALHERALARMSALEGVTIAIIDAVTEALAAESLDGRKENEVAAWYMSFPRKLADLGMAVVLIDHTPQENIARAIGSQHKKSAITGVSYSAEAVAKFSRGRKGRLRLRVAKDKLSGVRPHALPQKDAQEHRGDLVIDSSPGLAAPSVELWGVDPALLDRVDEPNNLDQGLVEGPTWEEREKVSFAVKKNPGLSKNALKAMIGGKAARAVLAIEAMVNEGEVKAVKEGQSIRHYPPDPPFEPVPDLGLFHDQGLG